jgi:acyl-coenzyme A thioesterase PaaI-like protein
MVVSEWYLKWALRCYPPLFFQRIWVTEIHKSFWGAEVKIVKSFFNRNYNKTIFGGTIFSATDPFYPVLFHQLLSHKGYKVLVWAKASQINFLKPGKTNLYFKIAINPDDIAGCEHILNTAGKYEQAYPIDVYDETGELCASVLHTVYVRNLTFIENQIAEIKSA